MINIQEEIKNAMKSKNTVKLGVLRQLKTEFTNASVRKGNANIELDETTIIGIIRKEISKREDSIEAFTKAGRNELVLKEQSEIAELQQYLPKGISDEDLNIIIDRNISELGATNKKDMGKVISKVLVEVAGRVDNKKVSQLIGSKLQ